MADRLDRTLRSTNQRLAASGLQLRNDEDDWQLTQAGRDWGVALPLCSRGEHRLQILWDPAVVSLLEGQGEQGSGSVRRRPANGSASAVKRSAG